MGTCGLAIEAAKRAIDDAGIDPKEIDLIVLATSSGDRRSRRRPWTCRRP